VTIIVNYTIMNSILLNGITHSSNIIIDMNYFIFYVIKMINKILLLTWIIILTTFIWSVLVIYKMSQDPNNDCMLHYVSDSRFWIATWYLENLEPWQHIDYQKLWKINWYCKGCDCTNLVASYQCNIVDLIYKLNK